MFLALSLTKVRVYLLPEEQVSLRLFASSGIFSQKMKLVITNSFLPIKPKMTSSLHRNLKNYLAKISSTFYPTKNQMDMHTDKLTKDFLKPTLPVSISNFMYVAP